MAGVSEPMLAMALVRLMFVAQTWWSVGGQVVGGRGREWALLRARCSPNNAAPSQELTAPSLEVLHVACFQKAAHARSYSQVWPQSGPPRASPHCLARLCATSGSRDLEAKVGALAVETRLCPLPPSPSLFFSLSLSFSCSLFFFLLS